MGEKVPIAIGRQIAGDGVRASGDRTRRRSQGAGHVHCRGCVGAAIAVLLPVAAIAACSGGSPSPTSTETASPTTSSPSPTPSPTSSTDLASTRAEAKVREFYAVEDAVGADPTTPLSKLEIVAVSSALEADRHEYQQWRDDGWLQHGATRLVEVNVLSVNLDNSDPSHGVVPTVAINVCIDVSGGAVVNKDGKPVAPSDAPKRGWEHILVSNYLWDKDPANGWRVASVSTLNDPPCDDA